MIVPAVLSFSFSSYADQPLRLLELSVSAICRVTSSGQATRELGKFEPYHHMLPGAPSDLHKTDGKF